VSGKEYAKFGGNTVCLELLYDETRLIFDAGTGIRNLGESLQGEKKTIHLFLSHAHLDHVIGFPFFAPIYDQNTEIYVWSPEENQKTCRELFHDLMNAAFFPIRLEQLQAKMHFEALDEKRTIEIGPLTLSLCKTDHPSLAYAFKIKTPHQTIGYATDNECAKGYFGPLEKAPVDPSLVSFFSGCDLLIHEAQYFPEEYQGKVGWGHSSITNVARLVQMTNARKWLVSHHDPKHKDQELNRLESFGKELLKQYQIPCEVSWIFDGLEIPIE